MIPFTIDCRPPFLVASFFEPHEMLSWSLTHPGKSIAREVAWIEVRNADLTVNTDPVALVKEKIAAEGLEDAIALMTSRNITRYHTAQSVVESDIATCLTTVGLSNGERVGMRIAEPVRLPGTINTLVHVARPLSEAAFLETLSIATQARTAAIIDAHVQRAGVEVTGTGTDCIVIAAPRGEHRAPFAGLHTTLGEAVGKAVYTATAEGIKTWREDFDALAASAANR
ncbi:hypothetical protein W911_08885 [Hyphomicrobium nitrativorans NL23]|uniref:Adenosylcobinamide amidohydrolase n=1 Tax=Hyphomicrobium nitrativorans NL23 TaxID=1029756 RepID=V5SDB7_9HYPH|nr:adenosylcobinamide amidohydrolase [Hyphomicrobium nitrativorans]AHB48482.1 hypothetical protein W911_08885 [Hyphomicrobium nitrativorans NL23]